MCNIVSFHEMNFMGMYEITLMMTMLMAAINHAYFISPVPFLNIILECEMVTIYFPVKLSKILNLHFYVHRAVQYVT